MKRIVQLTRDVALLLLLFCVSPAQAQQLAIHHIDVDQGDATLVITPNGRTMLIDAGLDGKGRVVADYLKRLGIGHIDAFVLTHYDSDHMGGIDKVVAQGITVGSWYDRGGWSPDDTCAPASSQLCQYMNAAVSPTALHAGSMVELDAGVTISVVASNGRVGTRSPYPQLTAENALSVTLLISHDGFNYLIGGDLTEAVEERLVLEAKVGDIDVYHVNHHGSETSTSLAFLQLIRPEVAIISAGSHCGFHHPRRAVMDDLRSIPDIDIYLTNKYLCGDPRGDNPPDDFIGDLDQVGADGAIVIAVQDSTYTVRVARTGAARTYSIEGLRGTAESDPGAVLRSPGGFLRLPVANPGSRVDRSQMVTFANTAATRDEYDYRAIRRQRRPTRDASPAMPAAIVITPSTLMTVLPR